MFWSTLLKDPTQNQQKKRQCTPEMESIQTREAEITNIKKMSDHRYNEAMEAKNNSCTKLVKFVSALMTGTRKQSSTTPKKKSVLEDTTQSKKQNVKKYQRLDEARRQVEATTKRIDKEIEFTERRKLILWTGGDKKGAVRELRKQKAAEKRKDSTLAALLTLDKHAEILEQADLQSTICNALACTSKDAVQQLDARKKDISVVESAVDNMQELNDCVDDVNAVLDPSDEFCEDELMKELEMSMTSCVDNEKITTLNVSYPVVPTLKPNAQKDEVMQFSSIMTAT